MLFYQQLIRISPTLATLTGHAAAVGEAKGPEVWLAALAGIDPDAVSGYQPYWAVRAHLLQRLARTPEAKNAYDRTIGLTEDPESSCSKDGPNFSPGPVEINPSYPSFL
jgi:predicted RNA polymerase sigma factor